MQPAVEAAEEMLRLAERQNDIALRLGAHRAASVAFYHFGALRRSQDHAEATLALYDPDRHRTLAYLYVADFRVNALSLLSLALLGLGFPEKAQLASREALAYARELAHPQSLLLALSFASQFAFLARDTEAVLAHAEAIAALSLETDVPPYEEILRHLTEDR
jgi:hypothetical protein